MYLPFTMFLLSIEIYLKESDIIVAEANLTSECVHDSIFKLFELNSLYPTPCELEKIP